MKREYYIIDERMTKVKAYGSEENMLKEKDRLDKEHKKYVMISGYAPSVLIHENHEKWC